MCFPNQNFSFFLEFSLTKLVEIVTPHPTLAVFGTQIISYQNMLSVSDVLVGRTITRQSFLYTYLNKIFEFVLCPFELRKPGDFAQDLQISKNFKDDWIKLGQNARYKLKKP